MAAINETRRESPQFRRASVRVTHFAGFIFQQIVFSANLASKKICLILTRVSRSD